MKTPDQLTRFLLDTAGVRGAHVRLEGSWQQIRAHAVDAGHYAAVAEALLGQAVAAAALLTAHVKVDARLSLQLRGDGPMRMLFAECTAGTLRGIVQMADSADEVEGLHDAIADDDATGDMRAAPLFGNELFGDDAVLALTIENPSVAGRDPVHYQGLVALQADSLPAALEDYFHRSEQLPTRLLLVADATGASGLLLQKLPGDEGDADGWARAGALLDTLGADELLECPVETLLTRLFHEEDVRLLERKSLNFGCSCSHERVTSMLQALGEDEARAAAASGVAEIRCEFCGQRYHFDADAIGTLFAVATHPLEPPRLQ